MSRQLACADGRNHAVPPNHRPPSASDADVVAGRPPIEEQLRLVTSARLRLRLSRKRFDSARAVFYSMKRAVAAASEELASSRREVAAARGAAAELGALPAREERRQQKQPPSARGAHCGGRKRKNREDDAGAADAPHRTAAESCVDVGCDTVLVVEGCGVAQANGAYARTTKTAHGEPVFAMAGRWKSKEVHYVVYKQFKMTDDWTLGIHPKRTMMEFEPCTYYYKLYRSKDGRKGWSVAQPLGRKPAPVMSMRTRSVNGLDASPAVAAAGNGPCSGKSEEVSCLFEPSPVAVASASEWGGAKTIVMPDQVVSSGGGDASSDGLLHSSPEDGMPRPLESSFAFARPLGMPAAPPSLGMLPMAPLPPSVPASSPPYSSSPGDPLGPPPPSAGMASLPPLTPAELSAVKEGMDSSDIERGLGDGLRSSPLPDDYLVLSDGLAPHLSPIEETKTVAV